MKTDKEWLLDVNIAYEKGKLKGRADGYSQAEKDYYKQTKIDKQSSYNRGYQQGSADAIEEYRKEMHDMIEGNEEFTDWQKYEILQCNELVAEQLKEQNNEI